MEDFESNQKVPEGQEEMTESRLLDEPRQGYYLQELFRGIYISIDRSKRKELLDLLNTKEGNYRFISLVGGLDCIADSKNYEGGSNYWYEMQKKDKMDFLDALPASFGTYEKSIMSEVLDSLFPSEKAPEAKTASSDLKKNILKLFREVFPSISSEKS